VIVRSFDELAVALDGRVTGSPWTGLTFAAACPACDGRLICWTRRSGPWPNSTPGYKCHDCGRQGDLVGLHLLVEKRDAVAA